MKITYVPMPTGNPVRSIGSASATRRAVKITLKNLKKWCALLRDFKSNRQSSPRGIKDYDHVCNGWTATTMIVDQEESRNRANENLENELRESLTSNNQSETQRVFGNDGDLRECQHGNQRLDA